MIFNYLTKRGLSAVISTVLILLIVVAAMTIIWVEVFPMLGQISENKITTLQISNEGYTSWDSQNKLAEIQVSRGSDSSSLEGFELIFDIDGNSLAYQNLEEILTNSKSVVYLDFTEVGEPKSVSLVPIYGGKRRGEVIGKMEIKDMRKKDLSGQGKIFEKVFEEENFGSLVILSHWQPGKNFDESTPVQEANVTIFYPDGKIYLSKKSDLHGVTRFDLPPGKYNLKQSYDEELWNILWGDEGYLEIKKNEQKEINLQRNEPFSESFRIYSGGVEATNGEVASRSNLDLKLGLKNLKTYERNVRGKVIIDRDKMGDYDFDHEIDETTISPEGEFLIEKNFALSETGDYSLFIEIYSELDGGWVKTDHWDWTPIIKVF